MAKDSDQLAGPPGATCDASAAIQANWPAPPRVRALTTLRTGAGISVAPFDSFNMGLRCGDEPKHALENRARLHDLLGLPSPPQWLHQVHGTAVSRVERSAPEEPTADASVTAVPAVVLAILTADCLPVLFTNSDGTEVAAAHAGWRGLAGGVLEATVRSMHSNPRELLAWLGPAAGPAHYEVGAEVRDAFLIDDANAADCFVATRPGHWLVDLYSLARRRLASVGVARISGGDHCTISESRHFYSHRRDQRTGRMASLIWIEPSPHCP